ncbi:MAG: HNH endonuclease, partial [Bacteroidia bacterium]|nr:HNH endonuclease [Bacteroidia bacterium]
DLGIKPVITVTRARDSESVLAGIEAVRNVLGTCWFDEKKCIDGIAALEGYKSEYDEEKKVMRNTPCHDWCVAGDTKVRTTNGWIPICNLKGDEYVWGYSVLDHRLKPAKITFAGITGEKKRLIKITLDNGKSIKATVNHLWMLRDESYARTDELMVGTSLMPFYENGNRGYMQVTLNDGSFADEHRYVYAMFNGTLDEGQHIHHKDNDHYNNNPDNLGSLSKEEHCGESFSGRGNLARREIDKTDYSREMYGRMTLWQFCKNCIKPFWGNYKLSYCCNTCRNEYRKKRDTEGLVPSRDRDYINKKGRESYWRVKERNKLAVLNHKIIKIENCSELETVYDLTSPELNNFVAEGVVIHNCSHGSDGFRTFAMGYAPKRKAKSGNRRILSGWAA